MNIANEYLDKFESSLRETIYADLKERGVIDLRMPDMPDVEEVWERVCTAYLPDGVREFAGYPTVSLGWMMYIGMAVAHLWDSDWAVHSANDKLYESLRDVRGYDCMDEYISEEVLALSDEANAMTARLVGDMALKVNSALRHEQFEPGTPAAFHAYVRSLHTLYLMGAAVELYRLGYKMTRLQ